MNAAEIAATLAGEISPEARSEVAGMLWGILAAFPEDRTVAAQAVAAVAQSLDLLIAEEREA